jgi:hypothetical protein
MKLLDQVSHEHGLCHAPESMELSIAPKKKNLMMEATTELLLVVVKA